MPVAAKITPSPVVGIDEDDVGLLDIGGVESSHRREQQGEQEGGE
jgi:hypothetical protein